MTTFRKRGFSRGAVGALISVPVAFCVWISSAAAQGNQPNAYTTTNVNQRAGPGTEYPTIVTVPARSYVTIHSCIRGFEWCDVSSPSARGWMAATYLQAYHAERYMPVAEFGPLVRLPVVAFDIQDYWSRYYRDRPFFPQMARWTAPRPRHPTVTPSTFYRPLSAHGSWVSMRGQYVWVPDRVGPRWRPYTEGRWVYTRPYGWTWVSDEPFGWATYHYGRWGFSKRIGWFWVPGTQWAPAWVAWRGSNDYLAWAPLPPERGSSVSVEISIGAVPDYYWQVVPSSAFLSVNLSNQIIRDDRRYLKDTRPLGNVTVVNNVVVNNAVNIQYVQQKTEEKVVVHEIAATSNFDQSGKVEGQTLQVLTATSTPSTEPTVSEAPPPAVKTIEEVAEESQTKEQAGDQPATEDLLASPPQAGEPPAGENAPVITEEPPAATELVEPELPAPPAQLPAPPLEMPAPSVEMPVPSAELPPPPTTESPPPPAGLPAPPADLPSPTPEMPAPPAELPAPPPSMPSPPAGLPVPPAELPATPPAMPPPPAGLPAPPAALPAPPAEMPPPPAGLPAPPAALPATPPEMPPPPPPPLPPPETSAPPAAEPSPSPPQEAVLPSPETCPEGTARQQDGTCGDVSQ